jgi:hypothetical protein
MKNGSLKFFLNPEPMRKVYLSKSNLADQDDIISFNNWARENNIDVINWKNGDPDNKVLTGDLFVIIPPESQPDGDAAFCIGKGNYSQLMYFLENHPKNSIPFQMVRAFIFYDDGFFSVNSINPIQENWQDRFAAINYHDVSEAHVLSFLSGYNSNQDGGDGGTDTPKADKSLLLLSGKNLDKK